MSAACATYLVDGMSCSSCARAIERAVVRNEGVLDASVNYAARTLTIRWDPGRIAAAELVSSVEDAGYRLAAAEDEDARAREAADTRALRVRLVVTGFFAMQAMLPSFVLWLDQAGELGARTRWWLALSSGVLATPAVFHGGWPFLVRAWRSIRARAPGMDLLVALGALSSWGWSVVALASGSDRVWFDTATAIVFFLLVGRLIEDGARRRGLDAVRALSRLSPDVARVAGREGLGLRPTNAVAIGEVFRVLPGERVPLDGVVVHGRARVDRSLLTGESAPVERGSGDAVEAGTLALDGALDVRVTAAVGGRALDRIVSTVERLLARRAPLQALADRVASRLVAIVLAVAALTAAVVIARGGALDTAFVRAVAVTVIACPCALGLATPMAVLVAAGRAARSGILFRDPESLERAAEVDRVCFDKTGTLTEGRPAIVDVRPASGVAKDEVLVAAAIAEQGSEHPLARALVRDDVAVVRGTTRAVPGAGVVFDREDGVRFVVGSVALLAREGIGVVPVDADGTVVHVARGGRALGAIVLADPVRESARAAIARLRDAGLEVAMLTGDRARVADAVARQVGIDRVLADLDPLDKVALVGEATASGRRVAFVGDGLNDAPALAAAHLGVAVRGATDVALASAHVALREGSVERLVDALALARRTRRIMRANVAWAIGYNAIAIPLAALGLVPPELAALAMAASSISVVLSSLRLRA